MHAAKHFDPQLGLDIHLYVFPPLPVPIPLPTPHIGIVLDPFDYIPIIGGTVHVNGVKRATAGTGGLNIHIPLGPWMPTMRMPMGPQWDDEIFMGSMTVVADGDPLSRMAMPVLDCNIVGLVNPFRLRKPKKPQLSLSLPTAVNLAIPNHVNVGGPPMISIMGMAFKGLFAGLGRLRRLKAVQRAFDGAGNRWRQLFGNMDPGFLKCKVLRAEPVDVRSGAVSVTQEDFSIPGRLPLTWTRRYRSDEIDHLGALGPGWSTPADIRLELSEDGVVFCPLQGPPAVYERLPLPGEGLIDPIDGARLARVAQPQGDELHLRTKDGLVHVFAAPPAHRMPLPGQPPRALRIERLEDRCGNAWTFQREGEHLKRIVERGLGDSPGRFIEVASQGGRVHAMQLHDPLSGSTWPLVGYRHDAEGDLVAVLDALDAARRFDYRAHRLVRHTDRVGLSFHYDYDPQARVVHSWGDGGLYDYHFAYHDTLHETEVTDSLGHTSLIKFDADGLPLCEIDPLGGCTFFEYDGWGRTTGVTDPNGLRTGFAYDARGNLTEFTRPDGSRIATQYDADDKATAITDPGGGVWRQRWDERGLLIAQTTPLGAQTRYDYDDRGQLLSHINARGAATHLAFNAHGNLHRLTNALGKAMSFEHNALGRLQQRVGLDGRRTDYRYDAKGRLLQVALPGGASIACHYDAEDQLIRYVDENGATTELLYVGIGQVGERTQPDGHKVQYLFDTEEQLTGLINQRGETYKLERDALGRITEEVDYWGQPRRYAYDPGGRILRSTDPLGRTIGFGTDLMGRVTRKTVPDRFDPKQSITETFKYNAAGHLIELKNAASHVTRKFDADGRLVEEQQNGFKVENGFDAVGNRVKRSTSACNTVQIAYDLLDQPSKITINDEAPITIERNALGQAIVETFNAQLQCTLRYNDDGLLASHAVLKDGAPLFSTRFDYDKAGNLTKRIDSEHGTNVYSSDPMGRILEHTDPTGQVKKYLNDPAGDRLKTRIQEVQMKQAVGGEHLPTLWSREGEHEGLNYSFDRAGNLTSRRHMNERQQPVLKLEWDANQRLIQSQWERGERHGQVTTYAYDPLGRRVFKKSPTHTTHFFWDGDALLGEVQQTNETAPTPAMDAKVADFNAARQRRQALNALHPRAREYIYRPGTFVPLALIDRQAALAASHATAQTAAMAPAAASGDAPSPLRAEVPKDEVAASRPEAGSADGLGTLGGMALGAQIATPSAPQPASPDDARDAAGLGQGGLSLGHGLSLGAASLTTLAAPSTAAPPPSGSDGGPVLRAAPQRDATRTELATTSGVFYYFNDPNGCPTRLATATGQVVWAASYSAWGRIAKLHIGVVEQPIRLQGQYFDSDTLLHYNLARYFDPESGAFISQDPIRLAGGHNVYNYARNTLNWADPLGCAANPANATHITYEGIKDGKPYIGYASKPGLGHSAEDVLNYRYPGSKMDEFDVKPQPFYVGEGQEGKNTARGLEQRTFEDRNGLEGTSNRQNPVGQSNPNRTAYLEAADKHRAASSSANAAGGAARSAC